MRFWLALTGLLLFAAGSAVGIAGARWIAPSPPVHDLSQFLPFNDAFVEREDLLANLDLSDEQKKKLDELKGKHKKDIAHLREEFRKTSEALRTDFMAVLTRTSAWSSRSSRPSAKESGPRTASGGTWRAWERKRVSRMAQERSYSRSCSGRSSRNGRS